MLPTDSPLRYGNRAVRYALTPLRDWSVVATRRSCEAEEVRSSWDLPPPPVVAGEEAEAREPGE